MRKIIATVLFSIAACAALLAQSTGRLSGTVLDPQEAMITNARVVCRNVQNGLAYESATNSEGLFHFPELPIGEYELTVSREGFQTLVQGGIQMLTGHTVELKLKMSIGSATQRIDVSEEALVVQSASSEVQTTVDSRSMRELPLNGRNPLELVVLTPGADFTPTGTMQGQQDNTGITVNGLRSTDNNYQLDGGNFNNPHFGSAPTLPNPDTLQEFTVQSSNFSARESGAGALVQLSTRSGTNQFHGSAFEFLRNQALDARNFFDSRRADFSRHQFGGTAGGPIRRDRTFFFASYQGTRKSGGSSLKNITVPSQAMRDGDFSQVAQKIVVDPTTGQPFPNNIIPQSRFDPLSVRLLPLLPLPPAGQLTYRGPSHQDQTDSQVLGKIDQALGSSDHISGRYYLDRNMNQRDLSSVPAVYSENRFRNQSLTLRDTRLFTPALTGVFSFSYSRTHRVQYPVAPFTNHDLTSKVPAGTAAGGRELRININQYVNINSAAIIDFDPQVYGARGQFSWARGAHLVQFGVDFERASEFGVDYSQNGGAWTFAPVRTANSSIRGSVGDSFASFLLGLPNTFAQSGSDYQQILGYKCQPWVQDDWKVSRNLTLNLGLRWEPSLPARDTHGPLPAFVPGMRSTVAPDAPAGLVFSGDIREAILPRDSNNFAPRAGFAWNVGSRARTVVRGGYGLYYRNVPLNFARHAATGAAFRSLSVSINTPPSFSDPYSATGGSPFPFTAPDLSQLKTYKFRRPVVTTAIDPSAFTGYTQSWSLFVEREILRGTSLSLGYVGNHSLKIIAGAQGNPAVYRPGATVADTDSRRLYSGMGSVTYYTGFQSGNYHSLQVSVTRRTRRGLSIISNYVYGKALDNGSDGTDGGLLGQPRDPFNSRIDHGPSDYDVRHRANIAVVYDLPRLTGRGGLATLLLNNWQMNAIATLQSGLPVTILSGTNRSLTGVALDNADLVGDPARPAGVDKVTQWFNTSAFALNALGTVGTAGRNILRQDGKTGVNLSMFKNTRVSERINTQLRFEAFNALNHANFGAPIASLAAANFGRVQSAADPRVIQMGLKLLF